MKDRTPAFPTKELPDHARLPAAEVAARWVRAYTDLRTHAALVQQAEDAAVRAKHARDAVLPPPELQVPGTPIDPGYPALYHAACDAAEAYLRLLQDPVYEREREAWQELEALRRVSPARPDDPSEGTCPGCGLAHPTHEGHQDDAPVPLRRPTGTSWWFLPTPPPEHLVLDLLRSTSTGSTTAWALRNAVPDSVTDEELADALVRLHQRGEATVLWSQYPQSSAEQALKTRLGYARGVTTRHPRVASPQ